MKGEITITTTKNKRKTNQQEPFLFDPNNVNIVYAYKMSKAGMMAVYIGGEEINLAYNQEIWDALEKRFCAPSVKPGYSMGIKPLNHRT